MKPRFVAALIVTSSSLASATLLAQSAPDHVVVRPGVATAPPWLGVQLGAKKEGVGVEVTNILRRSPADGSGVKIGDRIVAIEGEKVTSLREVQRVVRAQRPDAKISVTVQRGKKKLDLPFQLAQMPDPETIVERHLVGLPAPDFTFRYVGDGASSTLATLKGRPTVIDFWATWCGPCHVTQRELADIKKQYGDRINVIGVTSEAPEKVEQHLARFPAAYAMATDPQAAAHTAFGIASFPTLVILDAEQRVAAVIFGANSREMVEKKLANLVGAQSPPR